MEDEMNTLASLQYRIDASGEIFIDITLDDYSEEIIKKFATLLASITTTSFQVQTLKVAQEAFIEDGRKSELFMLVQEMIQKQKILDQLSEKEQDQDNEEDYSNKERKGSEDDDPLIKPTDLM